MAGFARDRGWAESSATVMVVPAATITQLAFPFGCQEAVKKSGLSQAQAKRSLIRKHLGDARLTVPAFFHNFLAANASRERKRRERDSYSRP